MTCVISVTSHIDAWDARTQNSFRSDQVVASLSKEIWLVVDLSLWNSG